MASTVEMAENQLLDLWQKIKIRSICLSFLFFNLFIQNCLNNFFWLSVSAKSDYATRFYKKYHEDFILVIFLLWTFRCNIQGGPFFVQNFFSIASCSWSENSIR